MLKKILLGAVVVYALVGFFLIPYIAKPKVVQALEQNLNAKASIDSIYLNPFSFTLEVDGFALKDPKTEQRLIALDHFGVDIDPFYLLMGKIVIAEVLLKKPYIYAKVDQNKQLNFTTLLKPTPSSKPKEEKKEKSSLPNILLERFVLEDGEVVYDDFSKKTPYHFALDRVGFKLYDITTQGNEAGEIAFYSSIGLGGVLDLRAKLHSVSPLKIDGRLKIEANQLYNQWLYVKDNLNIEVADGKLSLVAPFMYDQANLEKSGVFDLTLLLEKLRLKPKTKYKDILRLAHFQVDAQRINPFTKEVVVKDVVLSGLEVKAKRSKEGKVDWQRYLQTSFESTPSKEDNTTTQPQAKPWDVWVNKVAISKVSGAFDDSAVTPMVRTTLNDFALDVAQFHLNSSKPFSVDTALELDEQFVCQASSSVTQKPFFVEAMLDCKGFDLTHYNPYITQAAQQNLKRYDVDLQNAVVDLNTSLTLAQENNQTNITLSKANVVLHELKVAKRSTKEKLLKLQKLHIKDVALATKTKEITIDGVLLQKLYLYPKRYHNATLNLASVVEPKPAKKTPKKQQEKKSSPYHIALKKFQLQNSGVFFYDKALQKPTKVSLYPINLQANGIDSNKDTFLDYTLAMRLNKQGKIKLQGKVRHTPLLVASKIDLSSLSLRDFSHYVQESTNAIIKDGQINLDAKATYAKRGAKIPDVVIKGDFSLQDLGVATTFSESYIVALSKMDMNDFVLELLPNRAYINTVAIDGLFVDAFIDEKKVLNFSKIAKAQPKQEQPQPAPKEEKKEPFAFQVAKINIKNSNALFADYSLPIRFKTEIHEMQGNIYAVSNEPQEVSYIDLKGVVDKYGSMKLKGSLQSAAPKNYTDIAMAFRNLDLHAMSGYSAQFAGYKIKEGKLFVDLAYKINQGAMHGDNSIMIKNIVLGEEIEDENVTHLPLGLAIALLEDSDGIIDIDMPVEGDVNNPDFKYGKLLVKTFANLIVKAVAAPFKFLGAALGINAEELEFINYEAGSATLLPSEIEKLDKLTKILIKRPKIKVAFTPSYEEHIDAYALKTQLLIKKLLQESQMQSDQKLQNALTIELLEELYTKNHKEEELQQLHQAIEKEYKENEEVIALEYRKALIERVIQEQPLPADALKKLALQRVESIKRYLIEEKGISPSRLGVKEVVSVVAEGQKEVPLKVDIEVAD